jgi:ABC-type Na+ transport system ATPase subunit NatA
MMGGMTKTTIETRIAGLNSAHRRTLRACRVNTLTDAQRVRRVVRLSQVGRALFRALTTRR